MKFIKINSWKYNKINKLRLDKKNKNLFDPV